MSKNHIFLVILIIFIFDQSNGALNCNCKLGAKKRVIGGHYAKDNFLPWHIVIYENGRVKCGGFILSERYIVTAAHCVMSKKANSFRVAVGVNNLKRISWLNFYDVSSVHIPYDFNINKLQNGHDIGLLKLNRNIQFQKGKVEVACVKFKNRKIDDLFVAGFGSTKKIEIKNGVRSQGVFGDKMKYTSFYEPLNPRTSNFIIGIAKKRGEDVCIRDSGEPAHIQIKGKTAVVGIVSFSQYRKKLFSSVQTMCNGNTRFARLSFERKFIDNYVRKNYCEIK